MRESEIAELTQETRHRLVDSFSLSSEEWFYWGNDLTLVHAFPKQARSATPGD
jgi:hypothetical protein